MKSISSSISLLVISSLALQARVCGFSPLCHTSISSPSASSSTTGRSTNHANLLAITDANQEHSTSFESSIDRSSFLKKSAAAAAAAVTSAIFSPLQQASAGTDLPKVGTKAPDFNLPKTRSNTNTSIAELSKTGKWTVLYFYPGAFTSGCTLEARGFQKDIESYRALNTQIVGVSVDAIEKNNQFCEEEQLDFILLSDIGGKVSKLYGSALSIPGFGTFSNRQTYLVDPNGYVQYVFTDVESKVARHSGEVLDKLKELQG